MKLKGLIAGLLAALLIVNTVGIYLIVKEEQKQTEIALAEYDITTKIAIFYMDDFKLKYPDVLTLDASEIVYEMYDKRSELGLDEFKIG